MSIASELIAKAFQDGAVFGRSNQTGIVEASQNYALAKISPAGEGKRRVTKPGKACYCDDECTAERCSEAHDLREVMIELY